MKRIIYRAWSKFITFVGDIKFFGWKRPFFFVINAPGYKLRGEHYRQVIKLIQPGDVLLSRSEQYLDTYLIPGYFIHAGFFYGGTKERVIHAISDGVLIEDIINFMRTDVMVVLRPHEHHIERAIALAKSMVNMEYDFLFNFNNSNRLSCTEMIYVCYPRLIYPQKRFGKMVIYADDIYHNKNFTTIYDSRL